MIHASQREILVIIRALTHYLMDAMKHEDHNSATEIASMLHMLTHELESVKDK